MTREEQLACLTDRPCEVCKFHGENGCCKWTCVFEEEPTDAEPCDGESTSEIPNKWIPVSERLPEDGTWNLFTDGKKISVERYKLDALDHFYPNGRWFSLEEVVAWMPLPEPYKAESEETE